MNVISLVTIDNIPLADSRQIAKNIDVNHHDFFNNIIKKYQEEIEADFGQVRFENASVKTEKSRGTKYSKYALLTEDQAYVYLAYSQNTAQARACKRLLVKAFSEARRELAITKQELAELKQALLEAEITADNLTKLQDSLGTLYDLSWPLTRHHEACDQVEEAANSLLKRNTQNNIDRLTYAMKSYLPEVRALKKAFDESIQNFRETRKVMQLYHQIGRKIHPEKFR